MATNDSSFRRGHRKRLREKFHGGKLAEYELLELLLTYAIPQQDVKPIAYRLLRKFGDVFGVITAPIDLLKTVSGVGDYTATLLKLIREIKRTGYKNYMDSTPIFHNPTRLAEYCKLKLSGIRFENDQE